MTDVLFEAVKLVLSLAAIALAANLALRSAERFIAYSGIGEASAGFVVLALMSSMPEFTVAIFSVYEGVAGVSVGDVLGSHIFNIALIIGVLAALGAFKKFEKDPLIELVDVLFLASIIPILLVAFRAVSPLVGVILIGVFVLSLFKMSRGKIAEPAGLVRPSIGGRLKTFGMAVAGTAIVVLAASFAISSASEIIVALGVLPIVLGAKLVAIGTSLPELVFCFAATRSNRPNLALGDAIGANLTTITLVLGLVLLAAPFAVEIGKYAEILLFVMVSNLILWRYLVKGGISRIGGIVMVLLYILFQASI